MSAASFATQPPSAGPWTVEPRAQQRDPGPIKVAAAVILAPNGTRLADVRLAKDAAAIVCAVNALPVMLVALEGAIRAVNQLRGEFQAVKTVSVFPHTPLTRDELDLIAGNIFDAAKALRGASK